MRGLRRRLTLSYTVLVGGFIVLAAIALTWTAFGVAMRPLAEAIASGVSAGRSIVAQQPFITPDELTARMRSVVNRSDVAVFADPPAPPGLARRPLRPGPDYAPLAGGPPPNGQLPGDAGFRPPPQPRIPPPGLLETLAGVRPEFVRIGFVQIAVVPDRGAIAARSRAFVAVLIAASVLGVLAAWLIARWAAAQVVAPLNTVALELRRFAGGDFTPRTIDLHAGSDAGELVDAYNGAAAQVASAFEERVRTEERMRRFLGDASHELRTPLSIVIAYLDVLRKGGADDAAVRAQALSALGTETARMRRLVDRFVDLARLDQPETVQPIAIDVGELTADAIAAVTAARPGDVTYDAAPGAIASADPAELHEAIANLVDNALKYGAGAPVDVRVARADGTIEVRVSDGGPGIAPGEREKIFERFYRSSATSAIEGSGLGLAIARRAAARAGGTIVLESAEPGRTAFVLRLPAGAHRLAER